MKKSSKKSESKKELSKKELSKARGGLSAIDQYKGTSTTSRTTSTGIRRY